MDKNYTQDLQKGILGRAYKTIKSIKVDDVTKEPWREIFVSSVRGIHSEMCIPIKSKDLFWILNIEDRKTHAFSQHEMKSLESLTHEIGFLIERAWLSKFLDEFLGQTTDAIFSTDSQGVITMANRVACGLLGYTDKGKNGSLVGLALPKIVKDKSLASRLQAAEKVDNIPFDFEKSSGDPVRVLLSKFQLQKDFSTSILIAKDLALMERIQELEYLKKIYSAIAFQARPPLTLISLWLENLRTDLGEKQRDTSK